MPLNKEEGGGGQKLLPHLKYRKFKRIRSAGGRLAGQSNQAGENVQIVLLVDMRMKITLNV